MTPTDGADVPVISLWDTEENLRAAQATPAPHRRSAAREELGEQQRRDVQVYEVVHRAGPA